MRHVFTTLVTLILVTSPACRSRPAPAPSTSGATGPTPSSRAAASLSASAAPATSAPPRAAEAATGDADQPGAARAEPGDPRVERIRAKVREIQADQSLDKSDFGLACPGGEGAGQVRLFEGGGAVRRAALHFTHPGEGGEDHYQFYYDQGRLILVEYELRGISFAGTEQWIKTTQLQYHYHDGSAFLCTRKTAKVRLDASGGAPKGSLESLLSQASIEPDDCSRAGKAAERARLASLGPKGKDQLAKLFCPR